jgi:starch phosphorylase
VEEHYLSRAKAYCERTADLAGAGALVEWCKHIEENWPRVRFGDLEVNAAGGRNEFSVQVYLNGLAADSVRVELYADAKDGGKPELVEMRRGDALVGSTNAYCYSASITGARTAADYTPRIVPSHPMATVPLECGRILWYR